MKFSSRHISYTWVAAWIALFAVTMLNIVGIVAGSPILENWRDGLELVSGLQLAVLIALGPERIWYKLGTGPMAVVAAVVVGVGFVSDFGATRPGMFETMVTVVALATMTVAWLDTRPRDIVTTGDHANQSRLEPVLFDIESAEWRGCLLRYSRSEDRCSCPRGECAMSSDVTQRSGSRT